MLSEKTKERIKKLQALAERGVGGEKETAKVKLEKLLADNGIYSLEELEEDKVEYFLFSYKGKHEIKLLKQCVYKVLGAKADRTAYRSHGYRQKIGYYCTRAQKIEIELEFEFYRNVFYEELDTFMNAFIQVQNIFPTDAPTAADNLHSRFHLAGHGLASEGRSVQCRKSFDDLTVQRDAFSRLYNNGISNLNLIRVNLNQFPVFFDVGIVRADIHEACN